jgi:hypothetical protein
LSKAIVASNLIVFRELLSDRKMHYLPIRRIPPRLPRRDELSEDLCCANNLR